MNGFFPILLSAFFTGLAGGAHCLSMCGGIAGTLGMHSRFSSHIVSYQAGRLFSYTCLGLFCGLLLPLLGISPRMSDMGIVIRRCSSLLIAAIGLMQVFNVQALRVLERYGYRLWRPLNRFLQALLPIRSHSDAFLVGSLWGLLPCGLIYAALAIAISRANVLQAAAVMLAFGLGTLPAMFSVSLFSRQIAAYWQQPLLRRCLGAVIIALAIWAWH